MKPVALCVALWCLALLIVGTSYAAVVNVSAVAPVVDGADVAMLDLTGSFDIGGNEGHIWSNRPVQGQTFTPGNHAAGYRLSAVTLRNRSNVNGGSTATIRVGSVTGTTFNLIASETAAAVANSSNTYVTYRFDAPVSLSSGALYGFDVGVAGQGYITDNNTDTLYPGGSAYSSGSSGVGDANVTLRSGDRVFHADLMAVQSGSISASSTAPVVDGADIAQLAGAANIGGNEGHIWSNRPVQGQTFTTASDDPGYLLNAITLQNLNNTVPSSGSFTVQVATIGAGGLLPFATIVAPSTSYVPGDYITISLEESLQLAPGTMYGFDWGTNGSGFVTANHLDSAGDVYLGGSAYSSGTGSTPNNNGLLVRAGDRVFHLDLAAVPEPTTLLIWSLLAGLGVGLGWRRRK